MTQIQEPISKLPEMLTIRQAAKRGILPERTLRRLVAENKIKTVKSGNVAYLNYSALLESLNSGTGAIFD